MRRVFGEHCAPIVENQRVRQSPDHDDDTGGRKRGNRLERARVNKLAPALEQDGADSFQRQQQPREHPRGLPAPEKFYRREREENVNPHKERDARIVLARFVPYAERGSVSEQANNAHWQSEQYKHLEPHDSPFLSGLLDEAEALRRRSM